LDKFGKIASALWARSATRLDWFPASGDPLQTRICFLAELLLSSKKSITTFYKATVLVIKPLIDVEKEKNCASFSIQTLYFLLVRAQ